MICFLTFKSNNKTIKILNNNNNNNNAGSRVTTQII